LLAIEAGSDAGGEVLLLGPPVAAPALVTVPVGLVEPAV
jgi:hypothetical protein